MIRWNRKVKSKPPAWVDPNMFLGMPVVVKDWVPKDKAYLINQKPFDFIGKPVFDETGHEIRDRRKGSSALVQRVSVDQGVTGRTIYPAQDCGIIAGSERREDG